MIRLPSARPSASAPTTDLVRPGRIRQKSHKPPLLIGLALVCAIAISACGSAAKAATSSPSAAPAPTSISTVSTATIGSLGQVLVGSGGRTLYLLSSDHRATPTCTPVGGCTTTWPPLRPPAGGHLSAALGARASLLATIHTPSGPQLTYDGWPLYLFAGDSRAGVANGQGLHSFGGTWSAVAPSGQPAAAAPAASPSPAPTTSGYGY